MTEAEWLACEYLHSMLEFVAGQCSDRKLRLFSCACCLRIAYLYPTKRRQCLDDLQSWVEGFGTARDVFASIGKAFREWEPKSERRLIVREMALDSLLAFFDAPDTAQTDKLGIAISATLRARNAVAMSITPYSHDNDISEEREQVSLLREIFGNPFRPVSVDPGWLTPEVVTLARTIYDDRAFYRMPQLADALEEAGCTNTDILSHCRGPEPHVRGCWVVDLILGKE